MSWVFFTKTKTRNAAHICKNGRQRKVRTTNICNGTKRCRALACDNCSLLYASVRKILETETRETYENLAFFIIKTDQRALPLKSEFRSLFVTDEVRLDLRLIDTLRCSAAISLTREEIFPRILVLI